MIDDRLLARLYTAAHGDRWNVDRDRFAQALETSTAKAFAGRSPEPGELRKYVDGLHLEDLALACACAAGDEGAWQHFVLSYRPILYRAADAIDPAGGRELADSLYADLFGLAESDGERRSLFRYFHGRSSLGTWLRAVLAQRHVDRLRARRYSDPLPDDDSPAAIPSRAGPPDPERQRYVALMREALACALALLVPKDRLRIACYYAQQMTLARIGRLTGEHEATVSRQLARARSAIRVAITDRLRNTHELSEAAIAECFRSVSDDAGPLDLGELLGPAEALRAAASKETGDVRSKREGSA